MSLRPRDDDLGGRASKRYGGRRKPLPNLPFEGPRGYSLGCGRGGGGSRRARYCTRAAVTDDRSCAARQAAGNRRFTGEGLLMAGMTMNDMVMLSVDDHAIEPPDMFLGRMPAKYKDEAPRVAQYANGDERWIVEGRPWAGVGPAAVAGRRREELGDEPT